MSRRILTIITYEGHDAVLEKTLPEFRNRFHGVEVVSPVTRPSKFATRHVGLSRYCGPDSIARVQKALVNSLLRDEEFDEHWFTEGDSCLRPGAVFYGLGDTVRAVSKADPRDQSFFPVSIYPHFPWRFSKRSLERILPYMSLADGQGYPDRWMAEVLKLSGVQWEHWCRFYSDNYLSHDGYSAWRKYRSENEVDFVHGVKTLEDLGEALK